MKYLIVAAIVWAAAGCCGFEVRSTLYAEYEKYDAKAGYRLECVKEVPAWPKHRP